MPTRLNPLGAKGAGEAGTVGALPAVMNAIIDALAPLGVTHLDMPATSERIGKRSSKPRGGRLAACDTCAKLRGAIALTHSIRRPWPLIERRKSNGIIEESGVAAAVLNHPANGIA